MAGLERQLGWKAELRRRLGAHPWLKLVGISAFMPAFFTGYFLVLRHPVNPVTVMPFTAWDRAVAINPGALVIYLSLWVFVVLPPALMREKRELVVYAVAATTLAMAGLVVFFVWPTSVPVADFPASGHWAFARLKQIDASGNACPSLHVAFAVFTAIWLRGLLRDLGDRGILAGLTWLWCAGILYSTMATRQHVLIDVLAGAVLGAAAAIFFRRLRMGVPHRLAEGRSGGRK